MKRIAVLVACRARHNGMPVLKQVQEALQVLQLQSLKPGGRRERLQAGPEPSRNDLTVATGCVVHSPRLVQSTACCSLYRWRPGAPQTSLSTDVRRGHGSSDIDPTHGGCGGHPAALKMG